MKLTVFILLVGFSAKARVFFLDQTVGRNDEAESAKCFPHKLTDEEIEQFFIEKYDGKEIIERAEIHGYLFINQNAQLLDLFRLIMTKHGSSNKLLDDEKNSLTRPQNECMSQVLCTVKKIFGESEGLRVLYLIDQYGFNASTFAYTGHRDRGLNSAWTLEELVVVLLAVQMSPESIFPLMLDRQLIHSDRKTKEHMKQSSATIATAAINVYPSWDKKSFALKISTLYHELGHYIDERLKILFDHNLFQSYSQWSSGTTFRRGDNLISGYSKESFSEDFAESFTAYRIAPDKLKSKAPQKYSFLKNILYDGIEYSSEEQCRQQSYSQKVLNQIKTGREEIPLSTNEYRKLGRICREVYALSLNENFYSKKRLLRCIKNGLTNLKISKKYFDYYPHIKSEYRPFILARLERRQSNQYFATNEEAERAHEFFQAELRKVINAEIQKAQSYYLEYRDREWCGAWYDYYFSELNKLKEFLGADEKFMFTHRDQFRPIVVGLCAQEEGVNLGRTQ